jgi:hypothetical protein
MRPSRGVASARLCVKDDSGAVLDGQCKALTESVTTDLLAVGGSPVDERVSSAKVELTTVGC